MSERYSYEQRRSQIAEKMVKIAYDNIDPHIWACKNDEEKHRSIVNYFPLAEMAIKEMAEVATAAYHAGIGGTAFKFAIREYLQSQGLIPNF